MNYYNDFDPNCVAWLNELISEGLIPDGHVDGRSITEIDPNELNGYAQCHFFAGIGGWPLALRIAGVPDNEPLDTASCPCQPLSCAGKRGGEKDERHLWPELYRIESQRRPRRIYGEQVASPDGLEWFDGVSLDLEELGYAVGAFDLPAAWVKAPQLRQRLFWLADSNGERFEERPERNGGAIESRQQTSLGHDAVRCGDIARVGNSSGTGSGRYAGPISGAEGECGSGGQGPRSIRDIALDAGAAPRMGHTDQPRPQGRRLSWDSGSEWSPWAASVGVCGNDGLWRRVEPGIPPLAARLPSRVALIRGSGNAIVPQVAARFIQTVRDCLGGVGGVRLSQEIDFA